MGDTTTAPALKIEAARPGRLQDWRADFSVSQRGSKERTSSHFGSE
jgi:hypothetical protein